MMSRGIISLLNDYRIEKRKFLLLKRLQEITPSIGFIIDEHFAMDTFINNIIKNGLEYPLPTHRMPGESKNCHGNSWKVAYCFPDYKLVTGYALSYDVSPRDALNGVAWLRHSWLIKTTTGETIETVPEKYVRYFGVKVDGKNLERFRKVLTN